MLVLSCVIEIETGVGQRPARAALDGQHARPGTLRHRNRRTNRILDACELAGRAVAGDAVAARAGRPGPGSTKSLDVE